MKIVPRQWLSVATLSALLLSGAVQAGGAGAPPVARPAVPAVQPAQSQAQAGRTLLDRALKANGGDSLRGLRTMQQRSEMTFVDAQGQPVLVLVSVASVDYANGWMRATTLQGEQVVNEQFLTSGGAFASTPQSGTVPLPRQEARSLTDAFFYGAPGLRLGGEGRDSVKNLGEQTWLQVEGRDIRGTVLEVVTSGVRATYLLNSQGLVVAERYPVAGLGEVISVYGNFRTIGGVQVPGTTLGFAPNGVLLFVAKDLETKLNVTLPADTFKVPE